jgi:hypothetical protein
MSFNLPPNTTLTLADLSGNIANNGVLASNVYDSPILTSYPTTSTGLSLGHYHFSDASTNALKFLNVAGTGTGGHSFYTSNNVNAPIQTAKIDLSGITLDYTESAGNVIYSPDIFLLVDGSHIDFDPSVDLHNPPYNFNQTFNPIYMTQSNGFYVAGELAYAFITNSGSQIQIFRNNNILNPIPPNTVPSDFPNTDTTGLVIGQPVFSLTLPEPPITQIINLYKNISITDNSYNCVLTSSDLTFNSVSLQTTLSDLQIKQTTVNNQYISAGIYADGTAPTAPTTTIAQQYAFTPSWYFKNSAPAGKKINWYIGPDISMNVSQVLGLYMSIFNGITTSNDNSPFIVCYTQPQAGDSTFYHSKRTFIFNQSIQPIVNTRYFMFQSLNPSCPTPFHYGSTLINLQVSNVAGSSVGPFLESEIVLAFAIGSNSASAVNSVEFAVSKFGIMTPNGSQELLFIQS